MKYYCGIDLGLKGGIAVIDSKEKLHYLIAMPTKTIIVNKKKREQYDIPEVLRIINHTGASLFTFERLRPIPMQSSQTGFSLGYATGMIKTILVNNVYEELEPRAWQKEMFQGFTYTKDQTKIVSLNVASRLFPDFDFKKKDGLADAALMAIFIKRKYDKK